MSQCFFVNITDPHAVCLRLETSSTASPATAPLRRPQLPITLRPIHSNSDHWSDTRNHETRGGSPKVAPLAAPIAPPTAAPMLYPSRVFGIGNPGTATLNSASVISGVRNPIWSVSMLCQALSSLTRLSASFLDSNTPVTICHVVSSRYLLIDSLLTLRGPMHQARSATRHKSLRKSAKLC